MININLCQYDKYYKTPYVSDFTSDKLQRYPYNTEDINIIGALTGSALLDLSTLNQCNLLELGSITLQFVNDVLEFKITNGSGVSWNTKDVEDIWLANHGTGNFPDAYTINTIECKYKINIEGIFNCTEINTKKLILNGNGAMNGPFITCTTCDLSGTNNYLLNANVLCSGINLGSSKARLENCTISCKSYIQHGSDLSLLDCSVISPYAFLSNGYFLNSEITFGDLVLNGVKTNSSFVYDNSLKPSGTGIVTIDGSLKVNKNFLLSAPIVHITGETDVELMGSIKAQNIKVIFPQEQLQGDETPKLPIQIILKESGQLTTDTFLAVRPIELEGTTSDLRQIIKQKFTNNGVLNLGTITGNQYAINNIGLCNIDRTDAAGTLINIRNYAKADTTFKDNTSYILQFHNDLSGTISANNMECSGSIVEDVFGHYSYNDGFMRINESLILSKFTNQASGNIAANIVRLNNLCTNQGIIRANTIYLSGESSNNNSGKIFGDSYCVSKNSKNLGFMDKGTFEKGSVNSGNGYVDNGTFYNSNNYGKFNVSSFYSGSMNIFPGSGVNASFYDFCANSGIANKLFFYDNSYNLYSNTGAIFYDNSENISVITGFLPSGASMKENNTIVFRDNSFNNASGTVTSGVFTDNSLNSGVCYSCSFLDYSTNMSPGLNTDLRFYDLSFNGDTGLVLNSSFFDTVNKGKCSGSYVLFSGSRASNQKDILGVQSGSFINQAHNGKNIIDSSFILFSGASYNTGTMYLADCTLSHRSNNSSDGIIYLKNGSLLLTEQSTNHGYVQRVINFEETSARATLERQSDNRGTMSSLDQVDLNNSYNYGIIETTNAYLYSGTINHGLIASTTAFVSGSINSSSGRISVDSNLSLVANSVNYGRVQGYSGTISFIDKSVNHGIAIGSGINFTDYATNNGKIIGSGAFTNFSSNNGVVSGDASFDSTSTNNGIITGRLILDP